MVDVKKPEAEKKPEEKKSKKEKKAEKKEKSATKEVKPKVEEKKLEEGVDKKDDQSPSSPPPPPPPQEIVLSVFMHCEGCARKVRKCLIGFEGIEDVTTDCKTHKVVVKKENADPLKVLDRLKKKTHRQVDLLSPIPKPPAAEEAKKPEEKVLPIVEEKKEEPKVITVVLKVHMHCEPCSLEIKRRIERMKEVQEVIPDLKNSQVTVKGSFEPSKLVEYVHKRTGKHATIVNQDPPQEKKKDNKGKGGKAEKKGNNGDENKKTEEKEEVKAEVKGGDDGNVKAVANVDGGQTTTTVEEGAKVVELTRNEFQYYPPRYVMEMNAYPPQIFSDENPNACSIM